MQKHAAVRRGRVGARGHHGRALPPGAQGARRRAVRQPVLWGVARQPATGHPQCLHRRFTRFFYTGAAAILDHHAADLDRRFDAQRLGDRLSDAVVRVAIVWHPAAAAAPTQLRYFPAVPPDAEVPPYYVYTWSRR